MRILVVEDDPVLSDGLRVGLSLFGATLDTVSSCADGRAALALTEFDTLVLDLGLPDGCGLDLLRELRARGDRTPVLLLTAFDEVADRIKGLDAGADDYLGKPFALQELLARVRALSRRHIVDRAAHMTVNGVHLDSAGRTVTLAGTQLETSRREFQILEMLMSNAGHFLTKEQIHDHVWSYDVTPESNLVEVYVARLRRKLEGVRPGSYITTRRNVGYRFNAGVADD